LQFSCILFLFLFLLIFVQSVLGDDFPDKPPTLRLKNPENRKHTFLTADGVFDGFSGLSPGLWSVHSHLGVIIRDIVKQLERSPPKIVGGDPWGPDQKNASNPVSVVGGGPPAFNPNRSGSKNALPVDPWDGPPAGNQALPPSFNAVAGGANRRGSVENRFGLEERKDPEITPIPVPTVPSRFTEIEQLSLAEIQELLEEDMLLRNFVENLAVYKGPKSLRDDLQEDVFNASKENISKKEELEMMQREVKVLASVLQEEVRRAEELNKQQRARLSVSFSVCDVLFPDCISTDLFPKQS
jgi:hypothetical protein